MGPLKEQYVFLTTEPSNSVTHFCSTTSLVLLRILILVLIAFVCVCAHSLQEALRIAIILYLIPLRRCVSLSLEHTTLARLSDPPVSALHVFRLQVCIGPCLPLQVGVEIVTLGLCFAEQILSPAQVFFVHMYIES